MVWAEEDDASSDYCLHAGIHLRAVDQAEMGAVFCTDEEGLTQVRVVNVTNTPCELEWGDALFQVREVEEMCSAENIPDEVKAVLTEEQQVFLARYSNTEAQRTRAESSTGQTRKEGAPKCQASTVDFKDANEEGKEGKVSATPTARNVTFVMPDKNAEPNQPVVDLMTSERGSPDAQDRNNAEAEANRAARSKRARAKEKEVGRVFGAGLEALRVEEDARVRRQKYDAMPVKRNASLEEVLSKRYRVLSIAEEVFERDDVVINVVFCSGVGGLTEGCVKRADGKYVITAVAVEVDAVVAEAHRMNHPEVPMLRMKVQNTKKTLDAIAALLPRKFWCKTWVHASNSCKSASTANLLYSICGI